MGRNKFRYYSRYSHVGKSSFDKQNYQRLINAPQKKIDDTFTEDEKNISPENSFSDSAKPTTSEPKNIRPTKKPEIKKPWKSWGTQIQENVKGIILGLIVTAIITTTITVVWNQQRDLGRIDSNITSIKEDVTKLQSKYDSENNNTTDGKIAVSEIKKDLEYIKERLKKVELRVGL